MLSFFSWSIVLLATVFGLWSRVGATPLDNNNNILNVDDAEEVGRYGTLKSGLKSAYGAVTGSYSNVSSINIRPELWIPFDEIVDTNVDDLVVAAFLVVDQLHFVCNVLND